MFPSLKRTRWINYGLLLVLVIVVVLATQQVYLSTKKVLDVNQALDYFDEKQWVYAEQSLQAATTNERFSYKELETIQALAELAPITLYRERLVAIVDALAKQNEKPVDIYALKKQFSQLEAEVKQSKYANQWATLVKVYDPDRQLASTP